MAAISRCKEGKEKEVEVTLRLTIAEWHAMVGFSQEHQGPWAWGKYYGKQQHFQLEEE